MTPQSRAFLYAGHLDALCWSSAASLSLEKVQRDWLLFSGSLTAKLQQHTDSLSLQLLTSGWQQDEQLPGQMVRQVLLSDGQHPWVWGLTRVEASQLQQEADLQHWSEQPLGFLLFAEEQNMARRFEIADFAASAEFCSMLPQWGCTVRRPLWGRRSELQFRSCRLLLTEVFLPEHPMYGV